MPERFSSLRHLAVELISRGVPALGVLRAQLADAETYADFRHLIEEFLPERGQDILREPSPGAQVAAFADYFRDRYFPLEDIYRTGDIEGYEELTMRIPVVVMGMSWDDYDEIASDYKPGAQLITFLLENPHDEAGTINVSLAQACLDHVPRALLERVPENRLSQEEAHRLLDGTPYEGVALWADRIGNASGNFFLDTDWEYLGASESLEWDMGTVQALTRDWHQAEESEERLGRFVDWLEDDMPGRFEEILNFILEKRADE